MAADDELIEAPDQPTYEPDPDIPGIRVTPIPVMLRVSPQVRKTRPPRPPRPPRQTE